MNLHRLRFYSFFYLKEDFFLRGKNYTVFIFVDNLKPLQLCFNEFFFSISIFLIESVRNEECEKESNLLKCWGKLVFAHSFQLFPFHTLVSTTTTVSIHTRPYYVVQ